MEGIRFYLEFETNHRKRKGAHSGNVFAACVCNGLHPNGGWEGLGAVYYFPNSPVASTSASREYLSKFCKRISEEQARKIHPALFQILDRKD